ncbi:MAG: dockerin type I repeat-containing protein, partial [Oscillospiraceae bacterium]|nr:dockerin type I repeat-containing protein [Oscillospiraceae bacterium]
MQPSLAEITTETPTEPVTEAPTEPETDAPTEAPTEPETEAPTDAPELRGDVNLDGSVTVLDIVTLQKYLVRLDVLNARQLEQADLDGDDHVDVT